MQRFSTSPESELYDTVIRNINTALTVLFTVESILKMCGFGLRVRQSSTSRPPAGIDID
jgi:hypothetical protein